MPKVASSGRGMRLVKPQKVMKKTESMVGMGKTKVRDLVLKEEPLKKYISFKWSEILGLVYRWQTKRSSTSP